MFAEILFELQQRLEEQHQNAQSACSELTEIQAGSGEAILQSRELIARVDALLGWIY
jgi:hypothetical protein